MKILNSLCCSKWC